MFVFVVVVVVVKDWPRSGESHLSSNILRMSSINIADDAAIVLLFFLPPSLVVVFGNANVDERNWIDTSTNQCPSLDQMEMPERQTKDEILLLSRRLPLA